MPGKFTHPATVGGVGIIGRLRLVKAVENHEAQVKIYLEADYHGSDIVSAQIVEKLGHVWPSEWWRGITRQMNEDGVKYKILKHEIQVGEEHDEGDGRVGEVTTHLVDRELELTLCGLDEPEVIERDEAGVYVGSGAHIISAADCRDCWEIVVRVFFEHGGEDATKADLRVEVQRRIKEKRGK